MTKKNTRKRAALAALTLALGAQLTGCSPFLATTAAVAATPNLPVTPVSSAAPMVVASATPGPKASTGDAKAVSLFDGRVLDGKISLPGPNLSDTSTIEEAVKEASGGAVLQRLAGPGNGALTADNFDFRPGGEGSFTRPGVRQQIFLYRYGLTNGLIITEDKKVVAHYGGGPGDYAFYTYLAPEDVNGDGLTDLILYRNVEDNEDIYAYLFMMGEGGPSYAGSATVYSSTAQAGEDYDPATVVATAFDVVMRADQPGTYSMAEFRRTGQGEWQMQGKAQPFHWQEPGKGDGIPTFENLMPGENFHPTGR